MHLMCFSFELTDQEYVKEFARMNVGVTLIPGKEDRFLEKGIGLLLSQFPYSILKYYSKNMEKALNALRQSNPFDILHVDHLHMAHYRGSFDGIPVILDEHNVEYKILERCVEVERSILKKMLFAAQARKMKRFEAEKVREFSDVLAVSEGDRNILNSLGKNQTRVHVIPNGVDTEFFQLTIDARQSSGEALVFTGSMDWLPNEDAVLFFCREILPLIWKEKPQIKFYIVGKSPSPAIEVLAGQEPRIIVTGKVDDVRPFIEQAKVFVVPMRVGGGTRLKILEAMSMQKPVVSTTVGAEGIQYTDGKDIVLADRPQDFADQVIALLDDPSRAGRMGLSARKLVCDRYDWNIIGEKLCEIYREALSVK